VCHVALVPHQSLSSRRSCRVAKRELPSRWGDRPVGTSWVVPQTLQGSVDGTGRPPRNHVPSRLWTWPEERLALSRPTGKLSLGRGRRFQHPTGRRRHSRSRLGPDWLRQRCRWFILSSLRRASATTPRSRGRAVYFPRSAPPPRRPSLQHVTKVAKREIVGLMIAAVPTSRTRHPVRLLLLGVAIAALVFGAALRAMRVYFDWV